MRPDEKLDKDVGEYMRSGAPKGTKHDAGKAPWHLMPWRAADQLVAVLGFGAKKYGPENWRKVENARERYLSAAFRHLVAYARGEKTDPESNLPHLAHAMCSLAFMLEVDEGTVHALEPEPRDCGQCGRTPKMSEHAGVGYWRIGCQCGAYQNANTRTEVIALWNIDANKRAE